jgi:hypothetical protein
MISGPGTSTEVVGRVVSPDNKAVEGVRVLLLDTLFKGTNSFSDTIADITDKQGNFRLQVNTAGQYLLTAKDSVGRSFMEEVVIDQCDSLPHPVGTLIMDTMGSLQGFINDKTNFKANIAVILYKKDMPFMYLWRRGAFTIDSLAPGEVRMQIGGWIDDYSRANKWNIFFDVTVTILPGKTTILDTFFIEDSAGVKGDSAVRVQYVPAFSLPAENPLDPRGVAFPFPANGRIHAPQEWSRPDCENYDNYRLLLSEKTAGAAGFRSENSKVYAVPMGSVDYYGSKRRRPII